MIDLSVHLFQMFLKKILVAWCLQLWSSWSFLVTIPCKNFANCKQTTAIVVEIVAWILFANQRFFPKPFFNSQSLVWWSNSLRMESWKLTETAKYYATFAKQSRPRLNVQRDNEKCQHGQGQVTFLLLSILTWVFRNFLSINV